jgi:hypothetical protein
MAEGKKNKGFCVLVEEMRGCLSYVGGGGQSNITTFRGVEVYPGDAGKG